MDDKRPKGYMSKPFCPDFWLLLSYLIATKSKKTVFWPNQTHISIYFLVHHVVSFLHAYFWCLLLEVEFLEETSFCFWHCHPLALALALASSSSRHVYHNPMSLQLTFSRHFPAHFVISFDQMEQIGNHVLSHHTLSYCMVTKLRPTTSKEHQIRPFAMNQNIIYQSLTEWRLLKFVHFLYLAFYVRKWGQIWDVSIQTWLRIWKKLIE